MPVPRVPCDKLHNKGAYDGVRRRVVLSLVSLEKELLMKTTVWFLLLIVFAILQLRRRVRLGDADWDDVDTPT